MAKRDDIIKIEKALSVGGSIDLTNKEKLVNKHLLKLKRNELDTFSGTTHFFDAKQHIDTSQLLNIIRKLPKGASLHTHLSASLSLDKLFSYIIHADNLYANTIGEVYKLKFILTDVTDKIKEGWTLVKFLCNQEHYKDFLKSKLSLITRNHNESYPDINIAWKAFMAKFSATYDMFTYKPFLQFVVKAIFEELMLDNVYYVEFRTALLPIYDPNGSDSGEFCTIIQEIIEEFKKSHPEFLGAKLIISPSRRLDDETMKYAIATYKKLKTQFPNLIAGFDMVGFEELGRPLSDFSELLKDLKGHEMYFHAGETNNFGTETDLNLLNAIEMNCKRIGHAFSLIKHPEALKAVKEQNIAIEVMPISNQVLKLLTDLRNHPAACYIANGLNVVVCNDDPTIFGSCGLSYDWFLTFLAMTRQDAGLEVLKQLAINSLKYSAMNDEENIIAMEKWRKQWDQFIENIIQENGLDTSITHETSIKKIKI